jgi:formylglycine-generating enzyme required for sulfatase activity
MIPAIANNKRRISYATGGVLATALSITLLTGHGDVKIDMVHVKGGAFTMGCTDNVDNVCRSDEMPPHGVKVDDFYIGRYEVTQKQWVKVMGENPSENKGDKLPVENVSWNDVNTFIERLNAMTGKNYRLPTEAEWEYAARGGAKSRRYLYSGSGNLDEVAWYDKNSGKNVLKDDIREEYGKDRYVEFLKSNKNKPKVVGTKKPNELGIFDMSGNVIEWVNDLYQEDYYLTDYSRGPQINPQGPSYGIRRVGRGGSWDRDVRYCHVSWRHWYYPDAHNNGIGFRLARSVE